MSREPAPTVQMVVALAAEARPLIAAWGLSRDSGERLFPLYAGPEVRLVVSGVGRAAAAAATRFLAARADGSPVLGWINAGVAGHRTREPGQPILAHRLTNAANGDRWYPQLVFDPPCETAAVRTVDRPETDFPEDDVYEMEAAGFYACAARSATAELIQVFKVISDNAARPVRRLRPAQAGELMEAGLETLGELVARTGDLARELRRLQQRVPAVEQIVRRWRFTLTQRRQLEGLAVRLRALGEPLRVEELTDLRSARQVLGRLRRRIEGLPPRLR